jgi:hypothetical protein
LTVDSLCLQGGLLAALNLLVVALPLIELRGAVSKPIKSCFGALLVRAGFRSAVDTTPAVHIASDPAELPDAADAEQAPHTSQARQRAASGTTTTVNMPPIGKNDQLVRFRAGRNTVKPYSPLGNSLGETRKVMMAADAPIVSTCFCAPAAVHENFMVLVQVPNIEMGEEAQELEGGRTSADNLGSLSAAGNDEDMPVLRRILID